ncbi:DUF2894 domain-containing protein [Marinobacter nauticus]|uniref:DUF2894 domain-containing protein n=1 Tax=Marinobacter nauticus TaxID=2743 RepID=UPI001C55B1F5|nr:DUF2894 domain-containing protein [Marinobacter nauticus]MBW3197188.1 DUF2894 domain-containing protein [Marinobacter nauticus]MBY6182598.1 DUF2894 domain-containing protein [Marinobacter nauticus]
MTDLADTSLLAALQAADADQVDPVRLHYLASLERRLRSKGLQGSAHWHKLKQAVAGLQATDRENAEQHAAAEPGRRSPLLELVDTLNQAPDSVPVQAPRSPIEQLIFGATEEEELERSQATSNGPQPLKAMARATADHGFQALQNRIQDAIENIPEDAGPMNAHRLVSRAIAEMQRLSPAYLNRMVNYTDTLMALEKLGRKIEITKPK